MQDLTANERRQITRILDLERQLTDCENAYLKWKAIAIIGGAVFVGVIGVLLLASGQ